MKSKALFRTALAVLACAVSLSAVAGDGWEHSKKLTFDTTPEGADIKQSAGPVPVLVRLHSGNFTFAEAKPDGSDLRFLAADGKTPLKYHIESFDASNELGVAWVQVPKITGNAKTDSILMKWGNPKAESAGDAKATYDASQVFVYHFGGSEGVRDATGNGNHARESTAKPVANGPIGAGVAFEGKNRVEIAPSPSLKLTASAGFTVSAWVKPAYDGIIYTQRDGSNLLAFVLEGGMPTLKVEGATVKAKTPLKMGEWAHVAATAGGGKLKLYVNGVEAASASGNAPDLAGAAAIGEEFRGELDEVALSSVARSADYIRILAQAESADSPFLALADEAGGESLSYMSILLGAVTIDGWVVIGILMVMAVISVAVMVGKAKFLHQAQKANRTFLARFRTESEALLTPDSGAPANLGAEKGIRHSSIYRLYTIGLDEMHHRFEAMKKRNQPVILSDASLNAIRASMDAGLVRENQRLNSQIVLLTIAISGGPFLGLLGTVVGVMITFAAIAAAGDVNVNSIAPGIAAALVATVAGLAVAIPALFGYNWLASQIKNVSSDMQIFVDEFVTRVAELYGR